MIACPLVNTPCPLVNTPCPLVNTPRPLVDTPCPLVDIPGRIRETQPIEEEEIPEDILNRYRENQLYLPALTVGYVYDDRMDGHAKEAIKRWHATKTPFNYEGRPVTIPQDKLAKRRVI